MKPENQEPEAETAAPAPPPAATLVLESGAKETDAAEVARLRQERDEALALKKKVELRNMELEDNVRSLTAPPPKAESGKQKAETRTGWMDIYRAD